MKRTNILGGALLVSSFLVATYNIGLMLELTNSKERLRHSSLSKVTITHEPRNDLLGSFVAPTLYLYAVANYYGWNLEILPFAGSQQEALLKRHVALAGNISKDWGSGFQDASH
mmetsp:Transcript_16374/g.21430  ORF Transcript_16374/g.21430 Transcript_16374/m.21430 type:complete len:114 (-) Transcript_16374:11-352(-)